MSFGYLQGMPKAQAYEAPPIVLVLVVVLVLDWVEHAQRRADITVLSSPEKT